MTDDHTVPPAADACTDRDSQPPTRPPQPRGADLPYLRHITSPDESPSRWARRRRRHCVPGRAEDFTIPTDHDQSLLLGAQDVLRAMTSDRGLAWPPTNGDVLDALDQHAVGADLLASAVDGLRADYRTTRDADADELLMYLLGLTLAARRPRATARVWVRSRIRPRSGCEPGIVRPTRGPGSEATGRTVLPIATPSSRQPRHATPPAGR